MWVANKIYYRGNSSYIKAYHGENVIWEKELGPDYLTFTCVEPGGISLTNYGGNTPNIEY